MVVPSWLLIPIAALAYTAIAGVVSGFISTRVLPQGLRFEAMVVGGLFWPVTIFIILPMLFFAAIGRGLGR